MPNRITNNNPYVQLAISLLFGGVIGLLSSGFVLALNYINLKQSAFAHPLYLFVAPLVLLLIILIKRNTLFFPTKINEISHEASSHYWSSAMTPVNFIGPLLSHAAGMSLGREGAVVLFSAGLVRAVKLSWSFWGPVFAGIGFASVMGNYWLAPVFIFELFLTTSFLQKLLGLVGAVVAVLVTRHFEVPHLFGVYDFQDSMGFFHKLIFFFFFAAVAGYLMRYYKQLHKLLVAQIGRSQFFSPIAVSILLVVFLYLPEFSKYHSLGLSEFTDLNSDQFSMLTALLKLFFTLLSTSCGFLGGEFIPLVFSGTHFGGHFFQYFGLSSQLGGAFGAFILFAAGTRLKWTTLFLMVSLLGFSWIFWIYYTVSIAVSFSGEESLYQKLRQSFI